MIQALIDEAEAEKKRRASQGAPLNAQAAKKAAGEDASDNAAAGGDAATKKAGVTVQTNGGSAV